MIASVRRAQRSNVTLTRVIGRDKIAVSPIEGFGSIYFEQNVGHQARVAAVAVRKRVDKRQPVVESGGDLVQRHGLALMLVRDIVEQFLQLNDNHPRIDTG